MGGLAKGVGRIFGNTVRSVVHNPINILPAAVGVVTGSPLLAAAAAGGTAAIQGGNAGEILGSAATTGFGSYAGSSLGGYVGKALGGGGATRPILGMLAGQQLGTGLGAAAIQSMQRQQQYQQALAVGTGSASVPTFEDIRRNAIIATRKAFERHNIYGREPSKYAMALRKSNLPRYGMRLWKDLVKPRKPDAR